MSDDQLAFGWAEPDDTSSATDLLPRARTLAERLRSLAERGVYIGTSSWKYPGWLGQIYNPVLYATRGKLSQKRFNDSCLAEYTRVFPTVCGDFAFYQFPTPAFWRRTFEQVPDGFRFSLKVPEDVTVEHFPDLPRYGRRAGSDNRSFLDAALVADRLLAPLEPYRDRLGVLIFQFGTFHEGPLTDADRFAERLGQFLDRLPTDRFEFAVEVRNRAFLDQPSKYLDALRAHRVAHCLNSWTRMPSIGEQLELPDIATADHVAARFLLRPGRSYKQAVSAFSPYEQVKDTYAEGRDAMRRLLEIFLPQGQKVYVFVNNRLEGNAIETIESVVGDSTE
ncbi:MAG: DUF72 domain-containing protein [Planctomycetota bacterium]|nr:DUF72 domain-containing protein [Planctomycetota bacterium]